MTQPQTFVIPEDFDQRFERAFGLLAFIANRHVVDHMRRISVDLKMDTESVLIWGTLAQLNVLPSVSLDMDPMQALDERGMGIDLVLEPIRLATLAEITGLPRETVRRKLERLRAVGKAERTADGSWIFRSEGIGEFEREFTRNTVLQLLKTAQSLLRILGKTNPDQ